MKFGVCYYPEHWPRERWAEDARLMRQAGLDIVRIAEFAWALLEPAAGQFNWDWLDEAIGVLAGAGLEVVLGTPTATPPAWMSHQWPEVLRHDANGRARSHGSRRHYCPTSPVYRQFSRGIVEAMADRYGRDPRVTGWQIDNEFGGGHTAYCYCPACALAFREWLRGRYGDIDTLNEAWGNVFWSQLYSDWSQVPLPDNRIDKANPSHELDFMRFATASYVSYQQEQVDILRRLAPDHFVTHNFMGLFRELDQFALAEALDFAAWDSYPTGNQDRWGAALYPAAAGAAPDAGLAYDAGDPDIQGLAHDLTYGLKRAPFWVMEQQAGHINWGRVNPRIRRQTMRLWVWQAAAAGAEAVVFFRWRATRLAHEQYHSGLLRHDGEPDDSLTDLARLQSERPELDSLAAVARPPSEVALLFDFEDMWAIALQPHRAGFDYLAHLFVFYRALCQLGISVDVRPSTADLSPYRLVIAPTLHLVSPELVDRLDNYVQGGGALLLGVRSGFKTTSDLVSDQPLPGLLRPLVGATVTDWGALPDGVGWPLASSGDLPDFPGQAAFWVERLVLESAHALLTYAEGGAAALTVNRIGKGSAYYLGLYPTLAQARALLIHLAQDLILSDASSPEPAPGLRYVQRGPYRLLMNFTDQPQTVTLAAQTFTVLPRDVRFWSA